ncbi:MAG: hypothetical protein V3W20_06520 [Candidatus Neomarinimicrobiota bacterium]
MINEHCWIKEWNMLVCKFCGIIRRADGKNSKCPGKVKIGLR